MELAPFHDFPCDSVAMAHWIRTRALRMVHLSGSSHIGSCLSVADILAVLYGRILAIDSKNADWRERDRLLLSKGHAAAALYSTLAARGFFPEGWLDEYCRDDSILFGHVTNTVPGVELSTGSLGHGLSIGCGMALACRDTEPKHRVVVVMSDGELDEGSCWEAALFAPQHRLGRLTAVIDLNGLQGLDRVSDVISLEPLADKWRAFRWNVIEVDGHDHQQLEKALAMPSEPTEQPTVVLARTVKGKGISFMEDRLEWHYRSPDEDELKAALDELGEAL